VNVSIHPIIVRGNTTNILAVAFSGLATHWYAPSLKVFLRLVPWPLASLG
jgi:hypothetical protein